MQVDRNSLGLANRLASTKNNTPREDSNQGASRLFKILKRENSPTNFTKLARFRWIEPPLQISKQNGPDGSMRTFKFQIITIHRMNDASL